MDPSTKEHRTMSILLTVDLTGSGTNIHFLLESSLVMCDSRQQIAHVTRAAPHDEMVKNSTEALTSGRATLLALERQDGELSICI